MKIEGSTHNQMMLDSYQSRKIEQNTAKNATFDGLLKNQKPEENEKINKVTEMIDNIEKVKVELEHDLTVENLDRYKEALRSFLHYYTKNEMKMDYYFVKDSRTFMEKRVGIIQSIDEKMNQMTENMLETNKGHMETLHKIGEIQGLLVNLYI